MSELFHQLLHPLTFACILIVFAFGVIAIVAMIRATLLAVGELDGLLGPLSGAQRSGPGAALSRARLRELTDGRSLLSERPDHLLDEWLQLHVLRLARFEAGGWITGAALFCTFFLIAWVLANDVGPAIAGSGKESMVNLSHAVRTMGAKFVVSMVGIALSIFHGLCRARCVRYLHTAVAEAAHRLRDAAVSVLDYQVECSERQVELGTAQLALVQENESQLAQLLEGAGAIHRTVTYQHGETATRIDALKLSIEKLQSIEVSVKDIGTELSRSLQQTVKRDIVEGIRRELQDIVDGLQKALTDSFSSSLGTQITAITDELRKIEAAVASQAHSQVEDLLHKLSDAVSGGFATESSRMKEALTRFAEVVPALERQMRDLSRSASEDLAQRSAESSQASALLFERLGTVLESMERQQQGAVETGAQMRQFVLQSQGTLANSLAAANEQLAQRSQQSLTQLTTAMHAATGNAAEVYRSLVSEVESAAKMLQQARSDAADGAARLQQSSAVMRESLQRMSELVASLRDVAGVLGNSVQQARTTVESGSAALRVSTDAVAQHQRFIEDLSSRWPALTRQYLEASDQAFLKIAGSWKTQAESIRTAVEKIGESFAGSAVDFSDAVQDLGTQLDRMSDKGQAPAVRTRG